MIKIPPFQYSVVIGLLLSDGWLIIPSTTHKNARLGLAQSLEHFEYLWSVFSILSHYCSNYPIGRSRTRNGKVLYIIDLNTRSLPCFSDLYSLFYINPFGYSLRLRLCRYFVVRADVVRLPTSIYGRTRYTVTGGAEAKVKVIPENIYDLLTPVALAHWIMGDGKALSKGIALCTDS
jgi:hypothetical protein